MSYHFGEKSRRSEMNTIHGALDVVYGGDNSSKKCVNNRHGGIIGTIILCMNIWNALLDQACEEHVLTVDKQMIEINKAANKYRDLMQTIDSTGATHSTGAMIWNLSELPNCVCMDFFFKL